MKKVFFVFVLSLITANCFAQSLYAIKVKAGLLFPTNAQNGTNTSVELSHKLSEKWSLYSVFNYSFYDKDRVMVLPYRGEIYSNSEDNHSLYSISFGGRLIISRVETFKIYADFEAGYNHVNYNKYDMFIEIEKETNRLIAFYPNFSRKKSVSEDLFGIGFGLGFTQQLSEYYGFSLDYKRYVQSKNLEFFNHYFSLNLGLYHVI